MSMHTISGLVILLSLLVFSPSALSAPSTFIELHVSDEHGEPVQAFEVNASCEWQWSGWREGKDGLAVLEPYDLLFVDAKNPRPCEIFIRADGLAPCIVPVENPVGRIERNVNMAKGKPVKLTVRAPWKRSVPSTLTPILFYPQHESLIRMSQRRNNGEVKYPISEFYPTRVDAVEPGTYAFLVDERMPKICVLFDAPDVVRAYQAGPFCEEDWSDGGLEVELPEPASLTVSFTVPKASSGQLPDTSWLLDVGRYRCDTEGVIEPLATAQIETTSIDYTMSDLVSGKYWINVRATPTEDVVSPESAEAPNTRSFRDVRILRLESGEKETIHFRHVPFDADRYKGTHTASVKVLSCQDAPAAGFDYTLTYWDQHYGPVLVKQGEIPENGVIDFAGLTAAEHVVQGIDKAEALPQFMLEVNGGVLGRFPIHLSPELEKHEFTFTLAPGEGDIAPDITLTDISSGGEFHLADYRGRVLFLEFWATWCGPCRIPVQKCNEIISRRKEDWEGRCAIVAISIDENPDTVRTFIKKKGLEHLSHFWAGTGEPGFESTAAKVYGITGVPTGLLINQRGEIIWRGYAGKFDVEGEMDKLIAADADGALASGLPSVETH